MATKNPAASAASTADVTIGADGVITEGAGGAPKTIKARVLADGAFGKVNDVVEVAVDVAEASGELDAHPAAVKYAESLAPATPEGE